MDEYLLDEIYDLENFKTAYRNWLFRRYGFTAEYKQLFDQLYDTIFEWVLDEDEHRASDGRQLRRLFEDQSGLACREQWFTWDASVLEVLGALADDFGDCAGSWEHDYDPSEGMWLMLHNLKLDAFTDEIYFSEWTETHKKVSRILLKWMRRRYSKRGFGGLFTTKKRDLDMRNISLWYQLNGYILENGWG